MASKDYLFVNKDSSSPSLSRNTGTEAPLASRVNKHVQQQRFWKSSGPLRSWYRPFVRSDTTSSAPSSALSNAPSVDPTANPTGHFSRGQHSPGLPRRSVSASRQGSRTVHPAHGTSTDETISFRDKWEVPAELLRLIKDPGNAPDAFSTTVVPLTPVLVKVLQRHLKWAVEASVTEFTVQEGVRRVFSAVLQDRMRAYAFLAMATAQQKKVNALIFPRDQGPELYSYRATRMIREHIESHQESTSSYTLVDIFRLAMCEWMSGNHDAARIHLLYASKLWRTFEPRDPVDYHVLEVCSCEDLLFAIDVDKKPLLALNWLSPGLPEVQSLSIRYSLPAGQEESLSRTQSEAHNWSEESDSHQLRVLLKQIKSPLNEIVDACLLNLETIPGHHHVDFGSALKGPLWMGKRRIHAALHQLQSLQVPAPSPDDSLRRTLIILLLLASTTTKRRAARTSIQRLVERFQTSLEGTDKLRSSGTTQKISFAAREALQEPRLWLWMYTVGLAAARDLPTQCSARKWFTRRAFLLTIRLCGSSADSLHIESILTDYLYFDNALGETVKALSMAVGSHLTQQQTMAALGYDQL